MDADIDVQSVEMNTTMRPGIIISIPAKKHKFLLDLKVTHDNEETFKLTRKESIRRTTQISRASRHDVIVDVTTVWYERKNKYPQAL